MSRSRKILSVVAISVLVLVAISGIASAQEKIGVIDPQKVLFQHPKFEQAQKQIKTIVEKKQAEAKDAIDKTSDNNEKQRIFEAKRQEAAKEEQRIMEPLFKDIDLAIRTVAKAKGVTIVLDKTQVFFGGADITEDDIQEIKKKNA